MNTDAKLSPIMLCVYVWGGNSTSGAKLISEAQPKWLNLPKLIITTGNRRLNFP